MTLPRLLVVTVAFLLLSLTACGSAGKATRNEIAAKSAVTVAEIGRVLICAAFSALVHENVCSEKKAQ